jgi:hypothetical protein
MDKVAAAVVPSLTAEQQQQYAKRKQDGQCAADKVRFPARTACIASADAAAAMMQLLNKEITAMFSPASMQHFICWGVALRNLNQSKPLSAC